LEKKTLWGLRGDQSFGREVHLGLGGKRRTHSVLQQRGGETGIVEDARPPGCHVNTKLGTTTKREEKNSPG